MLNSGGSSLGSRPSSNTSAIGTPPRVGPRLQVLRGDVAGEAVDAGRDRRVGGEHELPTDRAHGLVERFTVGDAAVEQLEDQEPGVSLVEVEHPRGEAEGVERARPADAEHQLLFDAVAAIAAVEPIGDAPVFRRVVGMVGVEQDQLDPADRHQPDAGRDVAIGDRHVDGLG